MYPRFLPRPGGAKEWAIAAKAVGRARMPIEGARARRWHPDVVYANSVWSLPLVSGLGLARRPVLLHVQELSLALADFEAAHPGLLAGVPSRYIAVSDAVSVALQREYRVPVASFSVIRPFVVIPADLAAREWERGKPFVVGGMGNPTWIKGAVLWLLAAREVVDRLGEGSVRFRWIGVRDDQEGRQLRAMVDRLNLASSVDLVPETPTPLAELAALDLLAVTSWEESASLAVLESMALGVPVVAFRGVGGPEETMDAGGILVDGFSPAAMGAMIAELLRDPMRREAMALAGREQARSLGGPDVAARLVLDEILRLRP
jgi:glycosyltransferase involved in cell wall biosynthesis